MLTLKKGLFEEILKQCKAESPNEACGILAGKAKRVTKVYPMTNTDKSPQSFFMDPKEQFRVMKEFRNLGLEMVGIYHSHPETGAYPSAHDVELAFYPEVSFVIVSIKDKDNPSIRSFRIVESKIKEEVLTIQ